MVVVCAVVMFALCFWLLRVDVGGEDRGPSIATEADSPRPTEPSVAPSRGEQVAPPKAPAPAVSPVNIADEPATGADPPPQSITIRARRLPVRKPGQAGPMQAVTPEQPDVQPGARSKLLVKSVEVSVRLKNCIGCSHYKSNVIVVPQVCIYDSHTLTQLHRKPYAPLEESRGPTGFDELVDSNAQGRILAVRLHVSANTSGSDPEPSIKMRLTVAALCPSDAMQKGWSEGVQSERHSDPPARRAE